MTTTTAEITAADSTATTAVVTESPVVEKVEPATGGETQSTETNTEDEKMQISNEGV